MDFDNLEQYEIISNICGIYPNFSKYICKGTQISTSQNQTHSKVDVCHLDTFLFAPTSHRIWDTQLVRGDNQI